MTPRHDEPRIIIAGASSLLGAELRSLFESGRFATADFRLVDEESLAGTLTEAGGEAAVIQTAEEGAFSGAQFVFFAGSAEFTRRQAESALQSGARVIDLSGAMINRPDAHPYLPGLSASAPAPPAGPLWIPSAAATMAVMLALALRNLELRRISATCLLPVSEAGRAGIEELETQTTQLLSFQNAGKAIFDAQVAFSVLDRFGEASKVSLGAVRKRVREEVRACLAGHKLAAAIQVLHAPLFYGTTLSACAEISPKADVSAILHACQAAGFQVAEGGPSNISVAGESFAQMARPEPDPAEPGAWWFWCAADNVRLPAAQSVQFAEGLA
jgi:aspartate-semialdehyde dehydrogenase